MTSPVSAEYPNTTITSNLQSHYRQDNGLMQQNMSHQCAVWTHEHKLWTAVAVLVSTAFVVTIIKTSDTESITNTK
jgi:hypothetical protein